MSDVKVEYEQTISRGEAADLLSQLARAFAGDTDAEFPFGPGMVKLHVPDSVRTELEVEVEDDEVQVEIEFTWPLSRRNAGHMPAIAPRANVTKLAARANGAGRQGHTGRAKRK